MRIIPVLDLKAGLVVRAEGGRRDSYRPIATPLAASAEPVAVAEGLRRLAAFEAFYVADLDAIEGRPPQREALGRLKALVPRPEIWLDAGFASAAMLGAALADPALWPVLGTESQRDEALLRAHRDHPRLVLSLDFFVDGYRGPPAILASPELWPQWVIVMTLERVGTAAGPDLARLAAIKERAGGRKVVAAGGVRSEADLARLEAHGIASALVASALHDGSLMPARPDARGASGGTPPARRT